MPNTTRFKGSTFRSKQVNQVELEMGKIQLQVSKNQDLAVLIHSDIDKSNGGMNSNRGRKYQKKDLLFKTCETIESELPVSAER